MLNNKINPALGMMKSIEQQLQDFNSPLFKLIFNLKSIQRIQEQKIIYYFDEILRKADIDKHEVLFEMHIKAITQEKARLDKEEEVYYQKLEQATKPEIMPTYGLDKWLEVILAYPPTADTPDELADQLVIHHHMLMVNYQQQIAAQLGPQIQLAALPPLVPGQAPIAIPLLNVPKEFKSPAPIIDILKHNPVLREQLTAPIISSSSALAPPPPSSIKDSLMHGFATHHARANTGYFTSLNMARKIIHTNETEIAKHGINPEDHRFIRRLIEHIDSSMRELKEKTHAVSDALQQNNLRSLLVEFRPNIHEIPAAAMVAEPIYLEKYATTKTQTTEATLKEKPLPTTKIATPGDNSARVTNHTETIFAKKPAQERLDIPKRRIKPGHHLP